ncbi:MAG: hypothetical protein RLZZ126_1276 [Pseudomonadota bacterium]|jgi:creatinine amidohydrolase
MTLPSRFWSELSTRHFEQLATSPAVAQAVAVLPVAATEQHGPHLPTGVDSFIVDGVVQAALPHLPAALPAVFLPTLHIGKSNEHERFAGTLTLSSSTVIQEWTEIGAGVARAGFKKLLLLNAHGGHVGVMDLVARDLRSSQGLIVYSTSWQNLPLGDAVTGLFSAHEHRFGVHAGDIETSMMLALKPHLVDMALAQNFRSSSEDRASRYAILGNGKSAKLGWQMQDVNPQGAAGNAAAATADKGRALLDAAGLQLARLLQELSDLPLTTLN